MMDGSTVASPVATWPPRPRGSERGPSVGRKGLICRGHPRPAGLEVGRTSARTSCSGPTGEGGIRGRSAGRRWRRSRSSRRRHAGHRQRPRPQQPGVLRGADGHGLATQWPSVGDGCHVSPRRGGARRRGLESASRRRRRRAGGTGIAVQGGVSAVAAVVHRFAISESRAGLTGTPGCGPVDLPGPMTGATAPWDDDCSWRNRQGGVMTTAVTQVLHGGRTITTLRSRASCSRGGMPTA